MDIGDFRKVLEDVKTGDSTVDMALEKLQYFFFESIEFACLDHHRRMRTGLPEAIYGENKTPGQLVAIMEKMLAASGRVIATRISREKADAVLAEIPTLVYHEAARMITDTGSFSREREGKGTILVVAAGTSDMHAAEEAYVTAKYLGNNTEKIYDVGVAGIHRLFGRLEQIRSASALIVVAGMEGALPSVVAGMVDKPVVAVPTSIGYGVGQGGMAALLGMLNSCSPGVAVVNIDNGFGAGCFASLVNRA